MSENTDENLAEKVLNLRNQEEPLSQTEVGEELGISQSEVSRIERAHKSGKQAGKEVGKEEGYEEAMEKVRSFEKDDDTEEEEEDTYWCNYCEEEEGEQVEVDYMEAECPNGHDLSDDWSNI